MLRAGEDVGDLGHALGRHEVAGIDAEESAERGGGVAGRLGVLRQQQCGGREVRHQRYVGDVRDHQVGIGVGRQVGDQSVILRGKALDRGHGAGHAGKVGDQRVVVADPQEDGGRVGRDGLLGLAVRGAKSKPRIAQDQLIDLLLRGSRGDQRQGVQHVVHEGAGDCEVGRLQHEIVAPRGRTGQRAEHRRRSQVDHRNLVRRTRRRNQRQCDREVGLRGHQRRPAMRLRGIDQRTALVSGGK